MPFSKFKIKQKILFSARGGTSPTLIAFKNPEGEKDLAMFRHPRYFFWEGKRIEPKETHSHEFYIRKYCTFNLKKGQKSLFLFSSYI